MALNLHPKAKASLIAALAKGVGKIQVRNASFLEGITAFVAAYPANEALPSTGKLRDQLIEFVDDLPFVEFFVETLRRELAEGFDFNLEGGLANISELEKYSDPTEFSSRFVDMFDSLPWQYTATLYFSDDLLPANLFEQEFIFPLGKNQKILLPDLLFSENFPLSHPNPRVERRARPIGAGLLSQLGLGGAEWETGGSYFQHIDEGFIGIYGGGSVMDRAERRLESFLGLGLSTKLFSYNYRYDNEERKMQWIIHKKSNDGFELSTGFELDKDISSVMRHMTCFVFEHSYPEDNKRPWLISVLKKSNSIFDSDHSQTLLLSAKWFFDSFKGTDQTLRYIRLMTTIEILLGERADTTKASLGEILGNRLAYLIGKSHQDRADILNEFKKIYAVRSRILHHGKHKLNGAEKGYISKLKTYCERAIEEEVRLILA